MTDSPEADSSVTRWSLRRFRVWERNWTRLCDTIPAEDFAVAEQVQRNSNAGSAPYIHIGANEHMLVEHLRAIDHLIGQSSVVGGAHLPVSP